MALHEKSHQTRRARPLPRCCPSAETHKSLCVLHVLHAGSSGPTWLPGTPGPREGGEPETKPLAPVLLSPAHSASVPSMVGASSQLWREGKGRGGGVVRAPFTTLTSDTEGHLIAHWEETLGTNTVSAAPHLCRANTSRVCKQWS